MPRRENGLRSSRSRVRTRPRILVVCGGVRTEVGYLEGIRDSIPGRSVDINLRARAKSPQQVVDWAVKLSATGDFDQAWCVFDVDEFDLEEANRRASRHGVRLAVSDPCFELWLLLHFESHAAYVEDCKAAAMCLTKHIPDYDKTRLRFKDYEAGVGDAIERARKLPDEGNPSTGMWRLAMRIRDEEDDT